MHSETHLLQHFFQQRKKSESQIQPVLVRILRLNSGGGLLTNVSERAINLLPGCGQRPRGPKHSTNKKLREYMQNCILENKILTHATSKNK